MDVLILINLKTDLRTLYIQCTVYDMFEGYSNFPSFFLHIHEYKTFIKICTSPNHHHHHKNCNSIAYSLQFAESDFLHVGTDFGSGTPKDKPFGADVLLLNRWRPSAPS